MSDFHFLRPWWLVAIAPCALLLWHLHRSHDPVLRWRKVIDPHLLPHLLVQHEQPQFVQPVVLLSVIWLLAILALSGPTWQREAAPFGDDTAVLVVVLKVTASMEGSDIQPTRLARAVEKVHDLLAQRPGAKTALVAYSGTAHQVMPLTSDAGIISTFANELSPHVMPDEGDAAAAALELADHLVSSSGSRGWILWIADSVKPDQLPLLKKHQVASAVPIRILAACGAGPERQSLQDAATSLSLSLTELTPDDGDVKQLSSNTHFSTTASEQGERWRDSGYWLVPILCVASLGWFRRGWAIGGAL